MSADRWLDYAGPLCDCPGELRGLDDDEPADDRPDAADLAGLEYDLLGPAGGKP